MRRSGRFPRCNARCGIGSALVVGALIALSGCLTAVDRETRESAAETVDGDETAGWFDFTIHWDECEPAPLMQIEGIQDPPAGKHGFIRAREDGNFCFADGTPAKFIGFDVSCRAAMPTREQAPKVAGRLAKCGINLVRLHKLDLAFNVHPEPGYDRHDRVPPNLADRVDFFAAELIKRGIYLLLDACSNGYAPLPGDNLPQPLKDMRTQSGYMAAAVDDRYFEMHKAYMRAMYDRINPHTGRRYADEPAVIGISIVNEKNIFSLAVKANEDPDSPFTRLLLKRWNDWLLARYKSREGLKTVWTDAAGRCALRDNEDPAGGTVGFPTRTFAVNPAGGYTGVNSTARRGDLLAFLHDLQTDYFLRFRKFLRELGFKVPVSGSNLGMAWIPPHARSNARLDYMDNHSYFNGNYFHLGQRPAAGGIYNFHQLGCGAVPGKPFVCTEWNYYRNDDYRWEGPYLAAAYFALQDWDGLATYDYYGNCHRWWDEVEKSRDAGGIRFAETYNDPAWVGQHPAAAAMLVRGDVSPAVKRLHVGYSRTDTFNPVNSGFSRFFNFAFFLHRTEYSYFDDVYEGDADVVMQSGISAHGDYSKARRAILFSDNPAADVYGKNIGRGQAAAKLYPGLKFVDRSAGRLTFEGVPWHWGDIELPLEPGIRIDSIPPGATAFGVDVKGEHCLGFINDRHCVAPGFGAWFAKGRKTFIHNLYAMAMQYWGIATESDPKGGELVSDTGELRHNADDDYLLIDTPRSQAALGRIGGRDFRLGEVRIRAKTPLCSICVTSCDAKPIGESKRLLITACARTRNSTTGPTATPVLAEPVEAVLTLTGVPEGVRARVHTLDVRGIPKKTVETTVGKSGLELVLGRRDRTIWHVVELQSHGP